MRERVYLALGSNLGDRRANILEAVEALGKLKDTGVLKLSTLMETEAEGFEGPAFINACALIETSLKPLELLNAVKGIESSMGRALAEPVFDSGGRRIYTDRIIDIDILLYGDVKMQSERLTLPHPRMYERDFVMIPLKEIM